MLWTHVHAVDVVEGPVVGLPDDGKAPVRGEVRPATQLGRHEGVAHDPTLWVFVSAIGVVS